MSDIPQSAIEAAATELGELDLWKLPIDEYETVAKCLLQAAAPFMQQMDWPPGWVQGFLINAEQKGYADGIEAAAREIEERFIGLSDVTDAIRAIADRKPEAKE